jgi:hypothetical protein
MKRSSPPTRRAVPKRSGKRIPRKGRPRFKVSGKPDKELRAWIHKRPCAVPGCMDALLQGMFWPQYRSDVAHVRSRGAGGLDHRNVVPLCHTHHCEQHAVGRRTFERRHNIDLEVLAGVYDMRWQAHRAGAAG